MDILSSDLLAKNLFVLESTHLDNATYVLKSNWQELSQLTKREILRCELYQHRRP